MKKYIILILFSFLILNVFADNGGTPKPTQKPKLDGIFQTRTEDMKDAEEEEQARIIKNIKAFYKSMKSISGKFEEEILLSFIDQTHFLTGSFTFKKEKLFKLETFDSDKQIIVSDGEILLTYLVKDGICYKRKIKSAEDINTLFEILPVGDFDEKFNVTVAQNEFNYLLELKIKKDVEAKINFNKIIYIINKSDLLPNMVYLWSRDGRVLKLNLLEVIVNEKFKDSYFKLQIPEGVEIIEY